MAKTKTELKKCIKNYYNVISKKYRIDYIILYGSYANGHPKEFSDIDLALISNDFNGNFRDVIEFLSFAREDANAIDIEPVIYSTEEYRNTERGSFLYEIKRTGKVILKQGKWRI